MRRITPLSKRVLHFTAASWIRQIRRCATWFLCRLPAELSARSREGCLAHDAGLVQEIRCIELKVRCIELTARGAPDHVISRTGATGQPRHPLRNTRNL